MNVVLRIIPSPYTNSAGRKHVTITKDISAPRPNRNPKLLTADIDVVTESAKPADERIPADTSNERNVSPNA